jgi:hypothetical protein
MEFPEVAHIRARDTLSTYGPSQVRAPLPSQSATFASSSTGGAGLGYHKNGLPTEFASKALSEREKRAEQAQIDAEWLIDPKNHGHGPKREVKVPVFVATQGTYDEQGRLVGEWDDGQKSKGKATNEEMAAWFRSLPSSTSTSRQSSPPPAAKPIITGVFQDKSLVVPKSQWFIRRVLLSQHQQNQAPVQPISRPSSIGSLVDTYENQSEPKPQNFGYVLGPSNKGWQLLKMNGWEGGGLGPLPPPPPPEVVDLTLSDSDDDIEILDASTNDDDAIEIIDVKPSIFNLEPLTPRTSVIGPIQPPVYGPGRTAPIATTLKSDRLGIGINIAKKRITHTPREIKRHDRKVGWSNKRQKAEKPKDRERRERAETQRFAAALH